jgi:hypothetical protein
MMIKYLINFFLLHLVLTAFGACHEKQRQPNKYLIPQDYTGWVRINYKIKDTVSLPFENGFYLVRFPTSGLVSTSSEGEEGWASDEYYYYSDGGVHRLRETGDSKMIWGEIGYGTRQVPNQQPTKYGEFFVGTEQQFKEVGLKCLDSELNPIIGPIEKCFNESHQPPNTTLDKSAAAPTSPPPRR